MSLARRIAAIVVAAYLLLVFLDRFVLVTLAAWRLAMPMLLVLAEGVAIIGAGMLLRRSREFDLPRDFLFGYPVFGTLLFLVGLVTTNAAVMVTIVVIGALATVAPAASRLVRRQPAGWQPADQPAWLPAVLIILLCGFVIAQAPPTSLDELAYHLAIPHAWINEGRAVDLPLISHSYFPLGIESADLPLLAALGPIEGGIASHLLHLLAAIATTWLIARRTRSWLVTAAIVSTPALALTAGWSLVDWPLAGICVALVAALEDDDDRTIAVAVAAGLLTKYTFLPFALIAVVVTKKWRAALPGLAIGSVFFIRNLILTANPFAPFFGADAPHVSGYRGAFLSDYVFAGTFVDESLGIALLALCVLATGRIAAALLAAGIALFFLGPSSRILVPFFLIPAMSAAPALRGRVARVLLGLAVVLQTFLVVWFTERDRAFDLLAGRATEQQYLAKQRASYAAIEWLNQTLPPTSRTLIVGLNETYWFTRRVRGGGNFDGERVSRYLTVPTAEALREKLRRDGITHVALVHVAATTADERKREERETRLTPAAQRVLAQALDHFAAKVESRGDTTLFTLGVRRP